MRRSSGATKEVHVRDALAALKIELGDDDVAEIEAPYAPRLLSDFS